MRALAAYPAPLDRSRRISIFAQASGLGSVDGLVDRVIAVQSGMRDLVARLANKGFPRQVELVAAGYLDELYGQSVTPRSALVSTYLLNLWVPPPPRRNVPEGTFWAPTPAAVSVQDQQNCRC
jgi:hypothetical protein